MINFFLLAQLVTKKNAIWECRNSLKILSRKEQFVNQENKAKCRTCPNGKPSQAVWYLAFRVVQSQLSYT